MPYFSPLSAQKRAVYKNASSRKLHLINTRDFCKWKKQLGLWAHYPILPGAPSIYFYSSCLCLCKRFAMIAETQLERKIRISNLICINPSFGLVAGSPIPSQLLFQPHLISKSYSKTGWQRIMWHCLYSGCTYNLHSYKIIYMYETPLSQSRLQTEIPSSARSGRTCLGS